MGVVSHRHRRKNGSSPSAVGVGTPARCGMMAAPSAGETMNLGKPYLRRASASCLSAAARGIRVPCVLLVVLPAGGKTYRGSRRLRRASGSWLSAVACYIRVPCVPTAAQSAGVRRNLVNIVAPITVRRLLLMENVSYPSVAAGDTHVHCGLMVVPFVGVPIGVGQSSPPDGERFVAISNGTSSSPSHTCALRSNGSAICWGWNEYGQASPPEGEQFVSVSSGTVHTCALRPDGSVACWGSDESGQATPPEGERFTVGRVEVGG